MTQSFEYKNVIYTMNAKWLRWENGCHYWECNLLANHELEDYNGSMTLEFHQGTLFKENQPDIKFVLRTLADEVSAYDITYEGDYNTFLNECLLNDTEISVTTWNRLEEQAETFKEEILPEGIDAVDMYNDLKEMS